MANNKEQILNVNPLPTPGIPSARPSGPSDLRPAVGSAPGVARTRPMALRDRGSIRKVATSGPKVRFGHRRPSGLDGGSPLACRLQACPAGEPWHQFVRSGCHAGSAVLSYGRTPCPNSTLDERPLHCRRLLGRQTRSFWQAVVMKKVDVGTCYRGCGSTARTRSPRVVSVDT